MSQENLPRLDAFLEVVDAEVRTTRRASEVFYNSPEIEVAVDGERDIKRALDNVYGKFATAQVTAVEGDNEHAPTTHSEVRRRYWERARLVPSLYGPKPYDAVEQYFHVSQERDVETIMTEVLAQYPQHSIPRSMLTSVGMYSHAFGVDIMTSTRTANSLLRAQMPHLKRFAADTIAATACSPTAAANLAFQHFAADIVPAHIAAVSARPQGMPITGVLSKASFYPLLNVPEQEEKPLRISEADARGFMAVYRMERRPYSGDELALAEELYQQPSVQSSLLMFHMAIVDYSARYLAEHPERLAHSLLPFTEFFVLDDTPNDQMELLPNPKLLKVLGNNLLPAIAGIAIRGNTRIEDISPTQIGEAAAEARRRRVFQAQIGRFTNFDPQSRTLDLDAIFSRTCPAMQILTDGLSNWLPALYERAGQLPA